MSDAVIAANQREYRLPDRPVAVICADGCAEEYLALGFARGELPNLARLAANGYYGLARGALPSFTNVNNCAMVTGTPPSQTGIGGNYILDPDTGEEVMTNSSRFLRNDTILAAASAAGRRVAMVTAKDKLRELLSKGMNGIAVSAEKADDVSVKVNGIDDVESLAGPKPSIYSGDASLYVLRVGVELLRAGRADFLYLSLTDYMQHKYAPEAPESREFYRAIDAEIGRLLDLGAIVGITADHGMSSKDRLVHLPAELAPHGIQAQAVPIIKDRYTVHHSNLGGCIYLYLGDGEIDQALAVIRQIDGVDQALSREEAAQTFRLMPGRIGDIMVLGSPGVVFGDPEQVTLPPTLRSHGSLHEERVPVIGYGGNFDGFEFKENKDLGRFVFERVLG